MGAKPVAVEVDQDTGFATCFYDDDAFDFLDIHAKYRDRDLHVDVKSLTESFKLLKMRIADIQRDVDDQR